MTVDLVGHEFDNTGAAITTAVIDIFTVATGADDTTASASATVSTTTDGTGLWDEFNIADGTYDVRIKALGEIRWLRGEDQVQFAKLTVDNIQVRDAGDLFFGAGEDAAIRWSTGDASNHALVVGAGNDNTTIHFTSLANIATDWVQGANAADIELWLHNDAAPVSDYMRLGGHDGTTALIDVVGGTTLALQIAGNTELTVTASGLNVPANSDILFTGTTGTNDINLVDSVADALSIVRGSTDMVVFNTTGTPRITFTPATTFTGTITGPSGTWDSGGMDIATGDSYAIAGTDVLVAATLGSGVTASSLTSLGTITTLTATAIRASSNDSGSIGVSGTAFSDLFLASGAVINFSAGDVTITHAAGKLTFGGDGAVELDFNNHEMTNVDINSGAIDGTAIGAAAVAAGSFAAVVGTTGTYSGVLSVDDSTASTSTTTGSIHTNGGLGIVGALFVGGAIEAVGGIANARWNGAFFRTESTTQAEVRVDTTSRSAQSMMQIVGPQDITSGELNLRFLEGAGDGSAGDMAYSLGYEGTAAYLRLESQDIDTNATTADIFRVPDAQTTIDANTTWDINVFDYVCETCGKSSADPFACHGVDAPWHDDMELVALATRSGRVVDIPTEVLSRMERLKIITVDREELVNGDPQIFISLQRMPWFLMAGMAQVHNRVRKLEAAQ